MAGSWSRAPEAALLRPARDWRVANTCVENAMSSNQSCTFVIERDVPGAGKLTQPELVALSKTSCAVLDALGPSIQWIHSYVTGDRIYCIYSAPDAALIRRHAE